MVNRSNISSVFNLYDSALNQTRKRLEKRVIDGTHELEDFYAQFLKNHIVKYSPLFKNEAFRREMHRELEQRHRTSTLRFWAIDGTCKKVDTSDLTIFYGGSYVVKGELGLQNNPPLLSYHESEPDDVIHSIVAECLLCFYTLSELNNFCGKFHQYPHPHLFSLPGTSLVVGL